MAFQFPPLIPSEDRGAVDQQDALHFWFECRGKGRLQTLLELGPGIASASRTSSAGAGLVGWGGKVGLDIMKNRQKQGFFIGKVVIQRAASYPGLGHYVVRAGGMITLRGEQPAGSLNQGRSRCLGLVRA